MNGKNVEFIKDMTHISNALNFFGWDVTSSSCDYGVLVSLLLPSPNSPTWFSTHI